MDKQQRPGINFDVERNGMRLHVADALFISGMIMYSAADFYHIPATNWYVIQDFTFGDMCMYVLGHGEHDVIPVGEKYYGDQDYRWVYDSMNPHGIAVNIRRTFHYQIINDIRAKVGAVATINICDPAHVALGVLNSGTELLDFALMGAIGEARSFWCGNADYFQVRIDERNRGIPAYRYLKFSARLAYEASWTPIGEWDALYTHYLFVLQSEIRSYCTAATAQAQADESWRGDCGLPTSD